MSGSFDFGEAAEAIETLKNAAAAGDSDALERLSDLAGQDGPAGQIAARTLGDLGAGAPQAAYLGVVKEALDAFSQPNAAADPEQQ